MIILSLEQNKTHKQKPSVRKIKEVFVVIFLENIKVNETGKIKNGYDLIL